METNNESSSGSLQCKVRSLETKVEIYRKNISILEDKIKVYEEDSSIKAAKINEQLEQIAMLEKENNYLKSILEKSTMTTNANTKEDYSEIEKMRQMITELRNENNRLSNEIEMYNQDNSILITKVKEYEEARMNSLNANKESNEQIEKTFNSQISEYTMMILNEIKIISKYIDTYFNCDDISKVPDIYTLTSFPDDAIVNFDILKHSIITAMKNTINYKQKHEETILVYKKENENLRKVIENKINEISSVKKIMSQLKEENFNIKTQIEKVQYELNEKKEYDKQISMSFSELETNNNIYFDNVTSVINNELEKILHDEDMKHYASMILYNDYEGIALNSKFKFEDALDKMITVNIALVEDVKNLMGNVNKIKDNIADYGDVNEMNEKINQLHDEVINYEKVLADAKNERELLLSQIEMLEKNNKK